MCLGRLQELLMGKLLSVEVSLFVPLVTALTGSGVNVGIIQTPEANFVSVHWHPSTPHVCRAPLMQSV